MLQIQNVLDGYGGIGSRSSTSLSFVLGARGVLLRRPPLGAGGVRSRGQGQQSLRLLLLHAAVAAVRLPVQPAVARPSGAGRLQDRLLEGRSGVERNRLLDAARRVRPRLRDARRVGEGRLRGDLWLGAKLGGQVVPVHLRPDRFRALFLIAGLWYAIWFAIMVAVSIVLFVADLSSTSSEASSAAASGSARRSGTGSPHPSPTKSRAGSGSRRTTARVPGPGRSDYRGDRTRTKRSPSIAAFRGISTPPTRAETTRTSGTRFSTATAGSPRTSGSRRTAGRERATPRVSRLRQPALHGLQVGQQRPPLVQRLRRHRLARPGHRDHEGRPDAHEHSPSLAVFGNRLYMAYKSARAHHLWYNVFDGNELAGAGHRDHARRVGRAPATRRVLRSSTTGSTWPTRPPATAISGTTSSTATNWLDAGHRDHEGGRTRSSTGPSLAVFDSRLSWPTRPHGQRRSGTTSSRGTAGSTRTARSLETST